MLGGDDENGQNDLYERLNGSVSSQVTQQALRGVVDKDTCPSLTFKQRMYGFAGCFVIGWFIAFLSVLALPNIDKEPGRFALLYTAGNVCALGSTMFLWGPLRQLKRMFQKTRIIATCVYLGSMILTCVLAFTIKDVLLVLLSILIQFIAMVWYVLSYIPYARALAKKIIGKCIGTGSDGGE